MLLLFALAIAVPGASAQSRDDGIVFFQDVGPAGANGAYVLSASTPTAVVVFLHGRHEVGTGPYFDWLQYVAVSGATVVFPRYQSSARDTPAKTLPALRAGIEAGLGTVRNRNLPVIVVGYDYGARLAFYYAANAQRWGLPVPSAIDSIFPTTAPAGLPALGAIPAATRVLFQVEADQRPAGADLWSRLSRHPAARKHYRVVGASVGHRAPLANSAVARDTFWAPLEALIELALPSG